jgi:argininosuccinate lyase
MPFRDAHEVVGKAVRYCIDQGKDMPELTIEEWRAFSDKIEQDIAAAITLEASVNARRSTGGTALEKVKEEIERAKAGK